MSRLLLAAALALLLVSLAPVAAKPVEDAQGRAESRASAEASPREEETRQRPSRREVRQGKGHRAFTDAARGSSPVLSLPWPSRRTANRYLRAVRTEPQFYGIRPRER